MEQLKKKGLGEEKDEVERKWENWRRQGSSWEGNRIAREDMEVWKMTWRSR